MRSLTLLVLFVSFFISALAFAQHEDQRSPEVTSYAMSVTTLDASTFAIIDDIVLTPDGAYVSTANPVISGNLEVMSAITICIDDEETNCFIVGVELILSHNGTTLQCVSVVQNEDASDLGESCVVRTMEATQ